MFFKIKNKQAFVLRSECGWSRRCADLSVEGICGGLVHMLTDHDWVPLNLTTSNREYNCPGSIIQNGMKMRLHHWIKFMPRGDRFLLKRSQMTARVKRRLCKPVATCTKDRHITLLSPLRRPIAMLSAKYLMAVTVRASLPETCYPMPQLLQRCAQIVSRVEKNGISPPRLNSILTNSPIFGILKTFQGMSSRRLPQKK